MNYTSSIARRKAAWYLAAFAVAVLATGSPATAGEELRNQPGTIQEIGRSLFTIVPDADKGTRFLPERLPQEFKKDGLRVLFSGKVGEVPANVRLVGTPLELIEIQREEQRAAPRYSPRSAQ